MVATIHFFTIEKGGRRYRATCPYYQWKKVCEYFGLPREQIERGAAAGLPWYERMNSAEII